MATISTASAVFVDGPCPFLTCLDTGPHGHDICPDCEAVGFGNAFFGTCVRSWKWISDERRAELLGAIEGNQP
ncbi:hypothetical protein ACFFX1_55500 [Dactylosporangium sucinum]|uniref:Uncharacterized protein n=1 Tax=Dactylosporangium sucinum TaxID=1424081 RepID=A0A917U299_9ACTN|nr:hypothetical protein [Dactylosporangium sucinum]GGM52571.1 hypothetical protein GCM10007977_062640 [Dactylosporangium sucinum]